MVTERSEEPIPHPAVKRRAYYAVSLALKVKNDLSRTRRVPCALAVDAIKDVSHRWLEV